MFNKLKTLTLIMVLAVWTFSCRDISKSETTVIVDSLRNVELNFPDSLRTIDMVDAKVEVSKYFDNIGRYYLDTVSTLSSVSLALQSKAYNLRQKLLKVLPKISLTTGIGDDRLTREYYIVEGDMKLDRDELLLYCQRRLQKLDTNVLEKKNNRKLTVAADLNGQPAIWPKGAIIKYSVMRNSFSSKSLYDSTVVLMKAATSDWMETCNVKFEHLSNLDREVVYPETSPEPTFFVVRQINTRGAFIAQAFFPNDPPYERMLLVDDTFFSSPFSKRGVLRHELGHILGFRHEHIWSADASCAGENVIEEDLGATSVTPYDPYSIMHYPCGLNKDNRLLELTSFDRAGASKVYPF